MSFRRLTRINVTYMSKNLKRGIIDFFLENMTFEFLSQIVFIRRRTKMKSVGFGDIFFI